MAVFEVAVDQSVTGGIRPIVNVFHVSADDLDTVSEVLDSVTAAWVSHVRTVQHNTWRTDRLRIRTMDGILFGERLVGSFGTNATSGISPQVCALVTKTVPGLARRRYGKMYLGGINETDVDAGGNIVSASLTALNNAMALFRGALNTGGTPMVQPFWTTNVNNVREITSTFPVTALTVATRVATQKRRNRK